MVNHLISVLNVYIVYSGNWFHESKWSKIDLAINTLHFRDNTPNICLVQTSAGPIAKNMKTVSIPPQHECNIGIKISKRNSGDIALFEPVKDIQSLNLMIAKC